MMIVLRELSCQSRKERTTIGDKKCKISRNKFFQMSDSLRQCSSKCGSRDQSKGVAKGNDSDLVKHFQNGYWLSKLSYLSDTLDKLNDLNMRSLSLT